MTADEIKTLLTTVRKAYALLDPSWPIFKEMQYAVGFLMTKECLAREQESLPKPAKPVKLTSVKSKRKAGKYPPNDPRRPEESVKDYFERVVKPFRVGGEATQARVAGELKKQLKKLKLKQGREGEAITYDEPKEEKAA